MNLVGLLREIIYNDPPITYLDMDQFSDCDYCNESAGQIILETLLNSSISTIQYLNLSHNRSWFRYTNTGEDIKVVIDILTDVINNQTHSLQILNLESNYFSSISTQMLLTRI